MDYINELNNIKPDSSYIPENCNNIFDFGIYTNRAIQDIYNESSINILSNQIIMFSNITNESVIQEDAKSKLKEIKDKIIKVLKDIWEKIKGFFEKILKFIKNIFVKMKEEVFSVATEGEFDKAIKFFKDYNKKVIIFSKESDGKETQFVSKSDFINQADKYNKEMLDRIQYSFNYIKGIYTRAKSIDPRAQSAWISGEVKEREDIIKELKNSKSSGVYSYIVFGDGNKKLDDFNKSALKAELMMKLSNSYTNIMQDITSDNIDKYANDIKNNVYKDTSQKWIGTIKNGYDQAKNMINEAIKGANYVMYFDDYSDNDELYKDMNDFTDKYNINSAGPSFAIDYSNRCKDILQVLITIESCMEELLATNYKYNVKLVCNIINNYWKLNHDKKHVSPSLQSA